MVVVGQNKANLKAYVLSVDVVILDTYYLGTYRVLRQLEFISDTELASTKSLDAFNMFKCAGYLGKAPGCH